MLIWLPDLILKIIVICQNSCIFQKLIIILFESFALVHLKNALFNIFAYLWNLKKGPHVCYDTVSSLIFITPNSCNIVSVEK